MHLPTFDDASMTWSEPELVQTSKGLWPASGLSRTEGAHEDGGEWSAWVEYRLGGEVVHRSARTHIKHGLGAQSVTGSFA